MSGGTEFSSERPKGDAFGIEDAVRHAVAEFEMTGRSPMIPCITVIKIKTVKLSPGDDGPTRVPVVAIARIESLTTAEAIRAGQKLILQALGDRKGQTGAKMLPFDEREIINLAFGDVDVEQMEQDEREKIEDENIDDPERLRRHLSVVHGVPKDEVDGMEWVDVQLRHKSDHDRPPEDGLPEHDAESWLWRRVDLEAAEAEADETPSEAEGDDDTADGDQEDGATADVPAAEFREPADGDQED